MVWIEGANRIVISITEAIHMINDIASKTEMRRCVLVAFTGISIPIFYI